jgi:hypothetical protein
MRFLHHQTFRLSFEPFREPIERFEAALKQTPDRIALREIGETFVLPQLLHSAKTRQSTLLSPAMIRVRNATPMAITSFSRKAALSRIQPTAA